MDHRRAARELQMSILAGLTPARRLGMALDLTSWALTLRDDRLRERHRDEDEASFRRRRADATLRASPTAALP